MSKYKASLWIGLRGGISLKFRTVEPCKEITLKPLGVFLYDLESE
jgi:hypothetical protein